MALRLRKDKQSLSQTNGFSQPLTPSFFLLCYTVSTKTAKEAAKMLKAIPHRKKCQIPPSVI